MDRVVGFGIVGCGMISKWHAEAANNIQGARLAGCFDLNIANAKRFASEYECACFETYEEMLASDEVDIVCICTPSGLHAPLAVQAANAGKNIAVEKPMAITKEQLEEVIAAVEANHVKATVISQLRFTEAVQRVKQAVDRGQLGKILMANVYMKYNRSQEYYSSSGWRGTFKMDGGGALMNQGIHGIDLLQYLAGNVKSVYALCRTLARDIEVEDTACLTVEYKNGAIGTVQGTTSVEPGYPRQLEICGTRGTVVLEEDEIVRWDVDGKSLTAEELKKTSAAGFSDPGAIATKYHMLQLEDLVHAILEDRQTVVNVYEGRKAVDIILAAYESGRLGQKVDLE